MSDYINFTSSEENTLASDTIGGWTISQKKSIPRNKEWIEISAENLYKVSLKWIEVS